MHSCLIETAKIVLRSVDYGDVVRLVLAAASPRQRHADPPARSQQPNWASDGP
jgi:hypothetical protein